MQRFLLDVHFMMLLEELTHPKVFKIRYIRVSKFSRNIQSLVKRSWIWALVALNWWRFNSYLPPYALVEGGGLTALAKLNGKVVWRSCASVTASNEKITNAKGIQF